MAYTSKDFTSKKKIKEAIAAGEKITCYNPGLGVAPSDGTIYLEGPHCPKPHRWYAEGKMKNGWLVSIK